jgi:hypothetical protein
MKMTTLEMCVSVREYLEENYYVFEKMKPHVLLDSQVSYCRGRVGDIAESIERAGGGRTVNIK